VVKTVAQQTKTKMVLFVSLWWQWLTLLTHWKMYLKSWNFSRILFSFPCCFLYKKILSSPNSLFPNL